MYGGGLAVESVHTPLVRALGEGFDGAVPVRPVADTLKRVRDGVVMETVDREGLATAQTPQVARDIVERLGLREVLIGTNLDEARFMLMMNPRLRKTPPELSDETRHSFICSFTYSTGSLPPALRTVRSHPSPNRRSISRVPNRSSSGQGSRTTCTPSA